MVSGSWVSLKLTLDAEGFGEFCTEGHFRLSIYKKLGYKEEIASYTSIISLVPSMSLYK